MKTLTIALAVALIALPAAAAPHHGHSGKPMHGQEDEIHKHLFPPELVMEHQDEIDLKPSQAEEIKRLVVTSQAQFTELKWDLHGEMEKLERILSESRVDEQAAIRQVGKVMGYEMRLKQAHLSLVIKIKNVLTEEQQDMLRALRHESRLSRRPSPPGAPRAPMAPRAPRAPRAPEAPEPSGVR